LRSGFWRCFFLFASFFPPARVKYLPLAFITPVGYRWMNFFSCVFFLESSWAGGVDFYPSTLTVQLLELYRALSTSAPHLLNLSRSDPTFVVMSPSSSGVSFSVLSTSAFLSPYGPQVMVFLSHILFASSSERCSSFVSLCFNHLGPFNPLELFFVFLFRPFPFFATIAMRFFRIEFFPVRYLLCVLLIFFSSSSVLFCRLSHTFLPFIISACYFPFFTFFSPTKRCLCGN